MSASEDSAAVSEQGMRSGEAKTLWCSLRTGVAQRAKPPATGITHRSLQEIEGLGAAVRVKN